MESIAEHNGGDGSLAAISPSFERPVLKRRLVLLNSFCRLPRYGLLYCRARLFPDWLVLTGWGFRGRYHERVPLSEVTQVTWNPNHRTFPVLTITLRGDILLKIGLRGAALWKYAIEERISSRKRKIVVHRVRQFYSHHTIYRVPLEDANKSTG